ncbi:MAG TPA: alkaline phosphatase family protein [Streptosporangiaceae bacterium]|nr:alkaline phosphatase family protein [Streptosporangiaceae bacterium]
MSRRRFVGGTLGAAGAAGVVTSLPVAMQKALADTTGQPGSLSQIEHVVVFMQENRSFDTYFGTLRGVRGFDDPTAIKLPSGKPVWYQPDPKNKDGYELPFHADTLNTTAAAIVDLSHLWPVQHHAWAHGRMNEWIPVHRAADGDAAGPFTMAYYDRQDLPFHYALADAFTICDNYHCSVMGPTNPNRLYGWTAYIDPEGKFGGPAVDNGEYHPYTWTTYAERLQAAGISWRNYQEPDTGDDNPLFWFKQFKEAPKSSPLYQRGIAPVPPGTLAQAFAEDVRNDNLPQVSWIIGTNASTEHPPYLPAAGATVIHELLEALASNPRVFSKTVFFINYDENDGYFDHVPPPTAPPGTPGEYLSVLPEAAGGIAGPIGLGFRVPMIVVSPLSAGGYRSSQVYDHGSMIQFMERVFGVEEPNISDWRRETCGDLTGSLYLKRKGKPRVSLPSLPYNYLLNQYVNSQDQNPPAVPAKQALPHQEPGTRPEVP